MNFTPFPVLNTEHLVLRSLQPEDAPELLALRSDEKVNTYIDRPPTTALEEANSFITRILGGITNNTCLYWVITLKGSDSLVGTIGLWNFTPEKKLAEVGYELLPQHQGQGLMQETLTAVIGYGFRELGLEVLIASSHRHNTASLKLLKRNNFQPDPDHEVVPAEDSADFIGYYLKKDFWAVNRS
ncbi:MAG TPA: GNAT family N-acetyltransferase [Sphingobacteriaceae bacterium]